MEKITLTEKQARVVEILRENGEGMFASDIAEVDPALFTAGSRSVTPLAETLVKRDFMSKEKREHEVIDNKTGKPVVREHMVYSLTETGLAAEYEVKA